MRCDLSCPVDCKGPCKYHSVVAVNMLEIFQTEEFKAAFSDVTADNKSVRVKAMEIVIQRIRQAAIKEVAEEYHLEMAKVFEGQLKNTILLDERQKLKEAATRHRNYSAQILNEIWLKEEK